MMLIYAAHRYSFPGYVAGTVGMVVTGKGLSVQGEIKPEEAEVCSQDIQSEFISRKCSGGRDILHKVVGNDRPPAVDDIV